MLDECDTLGCCSSQQLTEKSDAYSIGVLMLEEWRWSRRGSRWRAATGRYIVRDEGGAGPDQGSVRPARAAGPGGGGLEQYMDLVLRCVEEAGADRPSMGEVVGEIERVLKMAGGPGPESASNSMSYASRTPRHPYGGDSPFDHSNSGLPSARVEPK